MYRSLNRLSATLIALTAALVVSGAAHAQQTVRLDLPVQPLADSLRALGFAANTNIVFDPQWVAGMKAPAVSGTTTAEAALVKLLAGTKLRYKFVDDKTVSLMPAREAPVKSGNTADIGRELQLATVADTAQPGPAAVETPHRESTVTPEETDAGGKGIPEILVKGARSLNTDIERTEDDIQPYVVFGRDEIRRSMATNIEDFLKNRLPMNVVQGTNSQSSVNSGGSSSSINLRGLGANQTLILLDGRRLPNSGNLLSFNQPDVNAIPLSMIERIEVLPSTAGGIYGGGATGGVINIITRQDYAGLEARLTYADTFRSDAASRRMDITGQLNLQDGRTRIRYTGSHQESDTLRVRDRDFLLRGRLLQDSNVPFVTSTILPVGYTANICSAATATSTTCNSTLLMFDNGMPLGGSRTFIPVGYRGISTDGGLALRANVGRYNLDISNDTNGGLEGMLNGPTVNSFTAGVQRDFTDRIRGFLDMQWSENVGDSMAGTLGTVSAVTLAGNAPNNPFTTPIRVAFPTPEVAFPVHNEFMRSQATAGVILTLPRRWTAAAEFSWAQTKSSMAWMSPVFRSTITAAYANGALDVMRDVNEYPLDYSSYLLDYPTSLNAPQRLIMADATVRLSGPVLQLPAGGLIFSALAEHRDQRTKSSYRYPTAATGVKTTAWYPPRSQVVDSLYVEATAPLLSSAMNIPLVHSLELQLSGRLDDYETRSPNPPVATSVPPFPAVTYGVNRVQATRYTAGLAYAPVESLKFRASMGTGFLPPAVNQIIPAAGTTTSAAAAASLRDPKRGGQPGSVGQFDTVTGGNPDLSAEDSETWSAGVVFTPTFVPGLRLSVDYTRIEKTGEIRQPGTAILLQYEDVYAGRITRGPLTAQDIQLGYTGGPVTFINNTNVNLSGTRVQAYDVQLDYDFTTARHGQFHFYALGTLQDEMGLQLAPNTAFINFVGTFGGYLEKRGNMGMTWSKDAWSLAWSAQYFDSYAVYPAGASATSIPTYALPQGSYTIPHQIYNDVIATYQFANTPAGGIFDGVEISLGVQNIFDKSPPILAVTTTQSPYSSYGDPRLRRFSLSLTRQF